MKLNEIKESLKKFFNWMWNSESIASYLVFLVFAYIIIKLIFFPVLSFGFQTKLPLAIVESCSMFHEGNFFSDFNLWWNNSKEKYVSFNITKENFEKFRFNTGLNKGDVILITGVSPENLKIGEILVFASPDGRAIIHRIVAIKNNNGKYTFSTQGDHNPGQISYEQEISEERIIGKAQAKLIPYAGWMKLIFFEGQRNSASRGLCKANY